LVRFGVKLTTDQIVERVDLLNEWILELVEKYYNYSPTPMVENGEGDDDSTPMKNRRRLNNNTNLAKKHEQEISKVIFEFFCLSPQLRNEFNIEILVDAMDHVEEDQQQVVEEEVNEKIENEEMEETSKKQKKKKRDVSPIRQMLGFGNKSSQSSSRGDDGDEEDEKRMRRKSFEREVIMREIGTKSQSIHPILISFRITRGELISGKHPTYHLIIESLPHPRRGQIMEELREYVELNQRKQKRRSWKKVELDGDLQINQEFVIGKKILPCSMPRDIKDTSKKKEEEEAHLIEDFQELDSFSWISPPYPFSHFRDFRHEVLRDFCFFFQLLLLIGGGM